MATTTAEKEQAKGAAPPEPNTPSEFGRTLDCVQGDAAETDNLAGSASASDSRIARRRQLIGKEFGDVQLLEELGHGGMGVVYKARQKSLDRLVAVKLLLSEQFHDEKRLARFRAEARAAACLTHPNIVQIYQVGECDAGHYFVMEYVEGPSLESLIYEGKLRLGSAINILLAVADAVHFAHSKGIIHRDLKPANIMVDQRRRPVIMDFGIAKFVGKSSKLTQEGVLMGTPAFMSPEQAGENAAEVGPQSDVYSLGAILYTMLAGRVPFDEGTTLKTVLKVIGPEMPPPIRSVRPRVPEHLERIALKCMQKDLADRYATAHLLAEELRTFLADPGKRSENRKPVLPALVLISTSSGQKIRFKKPASTIGRTSDCDVVIRAGDVSKHHCRIVIEEQGIAVEDLESANGTFVNGEKVQRCSLADGATVRFASHEFKARIVWPPSDSVH